MLTAPQIAEIRSRHSLAEIATRLGATLDRRGAGTCPLCGGGKGNRRFQIKPAEQAWVCAVCQDGGDVIRLVEKKVGLDFRAAIDWLGGAREIDPATAARDEARRAAERARKDAEAAKYREAERSRLYQLWREALDFRGTPVEAYLHGRGIEYLDGVRLKYRAAQPYFHGTEKDERGIDRPRAIFFGATMLAPFVDGGGRFIGLHMTWLDPARPGEKALIADPDSGEILPAKKCVGIRLAAIWTSRAAAIQESSTPPKASKRR